MRSVGLETRDGIWVECLLAVETEAIARAFPYLGEASDVAAHFCIQFKGAFGWSLEDNLDSPPARCPDAEKRVSAGQHLRAHGIMPRRFAANSCPGLNVGGGLEAERGES